MSLEGKLSQLRAGAVDRIPAEHLKIMHDAVAALAASGIQDAILRVGEAAPAFELPNAAGQLVRSADLLQKGPLVVIFYRGFW